MLMQHICATQLRIFRFANDGNDDDRVSFLLCSKFCNNKYDQANTISKRCHSAYISNIVCRRHRRLRRCRGRGRGRSHCPHSTS